MFHRLLSWGEPCFLAGMLCGLLVALCFRDAPTSPSLDVRPTTNLLRTYTVPGDLNAGFKPRSPSAAFEVAVIQ
jgi:hypothetical protein